MSLHRSIQSEQTAPWSPTISFRTCSLVFPQRQHWSRRSIGLAIQSFLLLRLRLSHPAHKDFVADSVGHGLFCGHEVVAVAVFPHLLLVFPGVFREDLH